VPTLIVEDEGRTWVVDIAADETLVVGRSFGCDLPVSAPRASRRHAAVEPSERGHLVRDLGSTNGTTVNGAPLDGPRALEDGDVLQLGECVIVYRSGP
jgi:pSer/pThr/pTyr-binding forkhead associated (FHA) protein